MSKYETVDIAPILMKLAEAIHKRSGIGQLPLDKCDAAVNRTRIEQAFDVYRFMEDELGIPMLAWLQAASRPGSKVPQQLLRDWYEDITRDEPPPG